MTVRGGHRRDSDAMRARDRIAPRARARAPPFLGTRPVTSAGRENAFDLTGEPADWSSNCARRSVRKVMTRQAALPDDSLPHWRERLEGRVPLRTFGAIAAARLARWKALARGRNDRIIAEKLWKPL